MDSRSPIKAFEDKLLGNDSACWVIIPLNLP